LAGNFRSPLSREFLLPGDSPFRSPSRHTERLGYPAATQSCHLESGKSIAD
jgi:hypothetical protein